MNDPIAPILMGLLPESGEPIPLETLRLLVTLRTDFERRINAWRNRAAREANPMVARAMRIIATRIDYHIVSRIQDALDRWRLHHPVGQACPVPTGCGFRPLTDLYAYAGDPAQYDTLSQLWRKLRIAPYVPHSRYLSAYTSLVLTSPKRNPIRYCAYYHQTLHDLRTRVIEARTLLQSPNPESDQEWYHGSHYEAWCNRNGYRPRTIQAWRRYCEECPDYRTLTYPVLSLNRARYTAMRFTARLFTAHAYEIARFLSRRPLKPPNAARIERYIPPTDYGWSIPPHEQERWQTRWNTDT